MAKPKLIRITTVPASLGGLLEGQLKFMTQYYDVVGIASSQKGGLTKVGKEENIRVIPVEMTRKITPVQDFKAVWQLYKIFKKEKPFMVHTHTPKAGTLGMMAAYLAKVPHRLHTVAGMPLLVAKGRKRKLLDLVEKITYWCATKVYPNSFGLKDIILENNFTTEKKLKVIGNGSSNGIDTEHFDNKLYSKEDKLNLRNSLGIKESDFVFLYVGRVVKDKGVNELVEAFKLLTKKGVENCKLVLLGTFEDELDPISPQARQEIDSNPNIVYMGWQSDVRPYFSISNVFAFPSYREGFPNVVMQAGAMGIPSIVTNINGCNEIIIPNQNGVIIPVQDAQSLFESMKLFYENHFDQDPKFDYDPEKIRKLIVEGYSRKAIWEAIRKEYASLT